MDRSDLLDQGRRRFEERAWTEAWDLLAASDRSTPLGSDDLERLAMAAYLTGRDAESTEAWSRAHQAWLQRGDPGRAVRCAFWLGFSLIQRGEVARGGGWLARAGHLVDEYRLDSVEQGYLLLPEGLMAIDAGELDAALGHFDQVGNLARQFGDADLSALGTIGRGETLLRLGRRADGMRELDRAMVSVTAGETSPVVAGLVYCAVIDACQKVFDLRRAHEWTTALDIWCDGQPGLVLYRGQCLVHRAQIFQLRGAWEQAIGEAQRARKWLGDPPHPAIGMAHYQLGELHRLRGRFDAAETAYRAAHADGHEPYPGLALLRLAEDRLEAAGAAIELALQAAQDQVNRTRLLPAYIEIMLATNRDAEARTATDELIEQARTAGTKPLSALAAQARGAVLLADDVPLAALDFLHDALRAWQEMDAPYEAALVRVLLADAYRRLDDHDRAEMEREAARHVFVELGAEPALARLEESHGRGVAQPVTKRELEVLRLVARGQTNREIAHALSISEKTVERHLSNIFTKLGVPNRASATAYAYDHDLVPH